jgi:DedD protein
VFSNPDNARQLQNKLNASQIKSYTEQIKTSAGEQTRVRIGPFSSQEQASQMRDRLKSQGLDGKVVGP